MSLADGQPGGPAVSVVVTTFRRRHGLPDVLRPLLGDPAAAEVVVVDDAGGDGTERLLTTMARSHPTLRPLVLPRNLGQPRARAAGIQAAVGPIVLSLDDDVVAAPGLVGGHRARHAAGPRLVLGYMPTTEPVPRAAGQFATLEYARNYEVHCRRYEADPQRIFTDFWAGNFSLPRAAFLAAVEGYDFPLRYHEDRDLGLRLRGRGLEPVFDRALLAHHQHARDLDAYLREGHAAGRGSRLLHAQHPDLGPFRLSRPLDEWPWPVRAAVAASDRPLLRAMGLRSLRGLVAVTGRAGRWRAEAGFAGVAKLIEARRGAREADAELRGSPPPV